MKPIRLLAAVVTALAIVLPGTLAAQSRSPAEQRSGDQRHPEMMARFGGAYENSRISGYVNTIGRKLVQHSNQPGDKWTFTVLDTPVVNAFAIPGGYVYVTRGLLALVNDEAELAGVLGHEIGHVTAGHGAERQDRGNKAGLGVIAGVLLGGLLNGSEGAQDAARIASQVATAYLTKNSREQEFEADKLGIRLLVKAGYDPYAQADFLENLAGQHQLDARLEGRDHNPNRVDFFSSHPATATRVREAISEAQRSGIRISSDAPRRERQYLETIDNMVFGDSAEQGFVRGRKFLHPELRFAFEVPADFNIVNSTRQIEARGANGAMMIVDSDRDPGGRLDRYLTRVWVPGIDRNHVISALSGVRDFRINGLDAVTGRITVTARSGKQVVQLTVIRMNDRLYRIQGVSPENGRSVRDALDTASRSFRRLSATEAASLKPYRLRLYQVRSGDTVNLLASTQPLPRLREERFRLMNDYDSGKEMRAGDLVKLIVQ